MTPESARHPRSKTFGPDVPSSVPSAPLWFKNSSLSCTSLARRSSIVAAFLSFYFPARFAICELQNANLGTAPRGFCKIFSRFGFFFQIWGHLLYSGFNRRLAFPGRRQSTNINAGGLRAKWFADDKCELRARAVRPKRTRGAASLSGLQPDSARVFK